MKVYFMSLYNHLPSSGFDRMFRSDVNVTFFFFNNLRLNYGYLLRFKNKQHQSIAAQAEKCLEIIV